MKTKEANNKSNLDFYVYIQSTGDQLFEVNQTALHINSLTTGSYYTFDLMVPHLMMCDPVMK